MSDVLKGKLDSLFARHTFGIKMGLDRMLGILELMGNPEKGFAAIHVAGTNGKGSVCAMVESILRRSGFPVGLYTSPHLVRMNERIRFDGNCATDDELGGLIDAVQPCADKVSAGLGDATFFEFGTAMAFEFFRRKKARIVVLETGMGGRLDATNVVVPMLSVITSIGIEHTAHLGKDLRSIAREKSGIIKTGRPVVCGHLEDEAREVILCAAAERQCATTFAEEEVAVTRLKQDLSGQKVSVWSQARDYGRMVLPLIGRHQLENCAIAVCAVQEVCRQLGTEPDPKAVRSGLESVRWPGRCDVLSSEPPVILDGAHNPDAGRRTARTVREIAGKRPVGLVCGMCDDKDARGFLSAFAGMVKKCWVVNLKTGRSVPRGKLAEMAAGFGWHVEEAEVPDALSEAERWALAENGLVCIAGSLYLAGEVLELKNLMPFQ